MKLYGAGELCHGCAMYLRACKHHTSMHAISMYIYIYVSCFFVKVWKHAEKGHRVAGTLVKGEIAFLEALN